TAEIAGNSIYNKRQQSKEHEKMACVATLAMVDIQHNQFYYAHVGDTRLYLLRDGSLIKISKDHSFVGFLEDSGRLTEKEAMKHPKRNEINKALGFSGQIETDESYIETGQSPFLPGDMLLLCSDGLTDMVNKHDITDIITQNTTLSAKVKKLIEAANNNGGRDNITVVLVQNDKKPLQQSATMPAASLKINDTSDKDVIPVKQNIVQSEPAPEKKGSGLTVLLGILCLLFLGTTVWLFLQQQNNNAPVSPLPVDTARAVRNEQETLLQDAFDNATGDTLVLSDTVFKSRVIITDTLHINKDTLYVKVQGNFMLQRDSTYNGPALVISPRCKLVILDGLKFRGFTTGIALQNTALTLKNVQFVNCLVPVQNDYVFAGKKSVTVKLPVLIPVDSLIKTTDGGNRAR
ncbi:MAG: serine/threonine-protein phosphatase, partial [Sphingobacteriales bacterium]